MQRALFILVSILPCFVNIVNTSDTLSLEALNEELEYVTNRLDYLIANQGDWDEGGLDQPMKDVTWSSLSKNIENLIKQTVQLHLSKLDLKCSDVNSSLKTIKTLEEDFINRLSTQQLDGEKLGNEVRECYEKAASWKEKQKDAEKSVKIASDSVNILKATVIEIQKNISQQEETATKIKNELQKLISESESTSKGQTDINSAILILEDKQEKLMEKMGYEMMRDLKNGNDNMKQENNFIKSFLDQIIGKTDELKGFEQYFKLKVEELLVKLYTEDDVAKGEDGSTREAIEQLRKEVSQQREDIMGLKQSSSVDDELLAVREAIRSIYASSRIDAAAIEDKVKEARRSCVTDDDVRRLVQTSQQSKCYTKVKHTPGRPLRLQIEIVSSSKLKT